YNVPQGAIAQMLRDNAARKVGTISHVGIGTFADPRNGGGRLSEKTKEDIVKIIELEGQEQLFYPRIPLDVAFIRGTYA
ncbi:MAG: 3-oxoacid CoA-transferase, partial [Coprococcus sp.]